MDYKAIHQLIQWFHRTKPKGFVKNEPKFSVEENQSNQNDLKINKSFDISQQTSNSSNQIDGIFQNQHSATFDQLLNSLRPCFHHNNENITEIHLKKKTDILNRDNKLLNRDSAVINRDSDVIKRDNDVIKRDNDVIKRDSDVIKRDNDVIKRDNDVIKRDSDVIKRDNDVIKRDNDVIKRDSDVIKRDNDVIKRDSDVIKRDSDLFIGTHNQFEYLLTKLLTRLNRLEIRLLQVNRILSLSNLIEHVYKAFESSSVDMAYVEFLMECYVSNVDDWKRYAIFNENKYTRNLIDSGNGKFNLILLCWSQGQISSIHDHAQAHCLMKMLQGSLTEVRYQEESKQSSDENGDARPLLEISRTELLENEVCYINDSIGLHKVGNSGPHPAAVSLHLYSPPFDICSTFDPHTGRKTPVQMSFWTMFGEKVMNLSQQ